jgi:hypothetical protein
LISAITVNEDRNTAFDADRDRLTLPAFVPAPIRHRKSEG